MTRPGLATPWRVEIRHPGGFVSGIELATTASYFDGFDFNELYPEPVSTAARAGAVVMTFAPPEGDVLRVAFDGRATPAFHLGNEATTTLLIDGVPVARVTYRTVVMP